jgi:RimJ/RimL family protein N-acetyltransferase
MPSIPPVLQTERLRLRPPTLDDFDACHALWSDPEVTRFIGGRPSTREEAWSRLLRYIGHWQAIGYGYWAIETLEGDYVGEVGFGDYRRAMTPPIDGVPEMGWALAPRAQGRGLALEAGRAVLEWRDTALEPGGTVCIIAPDHAASIRLAEKLGFAIRHEALYHERTTLVLYRP